ncbi:hypothetical protein [Pseudomonas versuta]|uniref:Aspartate-semialdehyde dehydrogenase n=1 Tax=Pseudomonas versuta TaxID=1788301 RepID=A0ABX3EC18_9PSED|nr:hypothetical protein [Pseudomonas versuta]ALE87080.1 aspartate-semialdehyde dehydrogenase [Pseudomonas versuta]OKA24581.1 aspartate-semialdehyde dehydrogenase [Pseudomonas versuta]
MLPPILPLSVVPVTSQQDPPRPRPDIPPVAPAQPSAGDSTINPGHQDGEQATLLLREEQQRQHDKRRREALERAGIGEQDAQSPEPDLPPVDGTQRQGMWIDIKV